MNPFKDDSPDEPLAKRIARAQEQYCAARLAEARGLIHPRAIELKTIARGIAFQKKGHSPQNPSVRPIAIVESNLKHSFALSAAASKPLLLETMRAKNYGIATSGGMEIWHTLTSLYLEGDRDKAALLVDSKNAFNDLPRIVMFFGLKCFAPYLVNGFVRKYGMAAAWRGRSPSTETRYSCRSAVAARGIHADRSITPAAWSS